MILVDTTPLVALVDPGDSLHARAMKDLDRLGRRQLSLCTPVLTEACFLLGHAIQRARLMEFLRRLPIHPVRMTDELGLWIDVFRWLARYSEHEPDLADGYLAVLSEREKGARVWTYDVEFRTTWRRPDGTPIRLAVSGTPRRVG